MPSKNATTGPAPSEGRLVHVVDDDDAMRDSLSFLLRMRGYRVSVYPTAGAFLAAGPPTEGCCLITDVQMPQMSGIELLQALQRASLQYPTIVLCGRPTPALEAAARTLGARAFMAKPFDPEALARAVGEAVAQAA